jgi:RHS repeat-associated protein
VPRAREGASALVVAAAAPRPTQRLAGSSRKLASGPSTRRHTSRLAAIRRTLQNAHGLRSSVRRDRGGQLRHRWYQHATGRYTRPDPLGVLPPERDAVNVFRYAHANPLRVYDPLGLDAFSDDPGVQDCMYCVFSKAGFGQMNIEEGFWLQCDGTKYTCSIWPSTKRQGTSTRTTTTSSPRPPGACGIFHTHPRGKEPQPSDCRGCDIDISKAQRLPVYTIHPSGVWKYDPNTDLITQELGSKWFKDPKKRCNKPCEGLQ